MSAKAIFLDRDGVINSAVIKNGKPFPPSSLDELIIPPDVPPALFLLKRAGYLLIVVTNQPDVARGTTSKEMVESINLELMKTLPIDEIRVCFHDDIDECDCRKPLPGLLTSAAKDFDVDLQSSIMIGDRWKDIEAGQRAGCKTIWLQQAYDEHPPLEDPDFIAANMTEAVEWILV